MTSFKHSVLTAVAVLALCSSAAVCQDPPSAIEDPIALDVSDEIPAHLQDPAFDIYVSLQTVRQAIADQDPGLLCDVALQLAEGERVLLRPHKSLSSDVVLKLATRVAAEKRDPATLDRLAKAAKNRGNGELVALIDFAKKTAQAKRTADPNLVVSVDQTTPEAFVIFKTMLDEIQRAKTLGDRESLDQIEKGLSTLTELHDKQRAYLAKLVTETRSAIPEKADPAMDVLRQLAMSSRGSFPGSGPSAAEKDRARSQIASLQGQIASLRGQLSGLQSRFNASRNDSEKRSLQQQIQSLQSRISSLSSQVSALRSRYRV